jgi:hypothetical protein
MLEEPSWKKGILREARVRNRILREESEKIGSSKI